MNHLKYIFNKNFRMFRFTIQSNNFICRIN